MLPAALVLLQVVLAELVLRRVALLISVVVVTVEMLSALVLPRVVLTGPSRGAHAVAARRTDMLSAALQVPVVLPTLKLMYAREQLRVVMLVALVLLRLTLLVGPNDNAGVGPGSETGDNSCVGAGRCWCRHWR